MSTVVLLSSGEIIIRLTFTVCGPWPNCPPMLCWTNESRNTLKNPPNRSANSPISTQATGDEK